MSYVKIICFHFALEGAILFHSIFRADFIFFDVTSPITSLGLQICNLHTYLFCEAHLWVYAPKVPTLLQ